MDLMAMDWFFTEIHIEFCIFFHVYQTSYCPVNSIVEISTVIASIVLWVVFCLSRGVWKLDRESVPSPSTNCVFFSCCFLMGLSYWSIPGWVAACANILLGFFCVSMFSPIHAGSLVSFPLRTVYCCHRFIVKLGLLIYPGLGCCVYKNLFGVAAEFFWPR